MTIQEVGSLGELIAAIATLVTLAYLAVQIRQNTMVSRASTVQTTVQFSADLVESLYRDRSVEAAGSSAAQLLGRERPE